jgi:hypothetical protein
MHSPSTQIPSRQPALSTQLAAVVELLSEPSVVASLSVVVVVVVVVVVDAAVVVSPVVGSVVEVVALPAVVVPEPVVDPLPPVLESTMVSAVSSVLPSEVEESSPALPLVSPSMYSAQPARRRRGRVVTIGRRRIS